MLSFLVVVLVMTACPGGEIAVPSSTVPPSSTVVPSPTAGNLAPDFELPDLNGRFASLRSFRGQPVMLNFWATWCGPCQSEMLFLQQINDKWSDKGLVFLAVDVGENPTTVAAFVQSNSYTFRVMLDIDTKVTEAYGIRGIPTTFFIDTEGEIQSMKVGSFQDVAEIEGYLGQIMP